MRMYMRIGLLIVVISVQLFAWQLLGFGSKTKEQKVTVKTAIPMDVGYENMAARLHLNAIREAMGMNRLLSHDLLNIAAQGHADYLVSNKTSSHFQVQGSPEFVGERPLDRTLEANYASTRVSENISSHSYSGENSIDSLFSAIYHRFGFLGFNIDQIGVGVTQETKQTSNTAFVYVMGNSAVERLCHEKGFKGNSKYYYKVCKNAAHRIGEKVFEKALNENKRYNPELVVYPYDGQQEVPPVFYDESPDPLPSYDVSGFPVSIEFNDYYYKEVEVDAFRLFDSDNYEVREVLFMHKANDPHGRFTDMQFALFSLKRLEYNTEYKAEVVYRVNDKVETLKWTFRTKKPTGKLHRVVSKDATVFLTKGQSHVLYFPPHDAYDMLNSIQFPESVDIVFLDHNTLKLTVIDKNLDAFTIRSAKRTIQVKMQ